MIQPYYDFDEERKRAHRKHGDNSMEGSMSDERRLAIVLEELGEVAKELNDQVLDGEKRPQRVREELVQVGAMVAAWVDRIDIEWRRAHREPRVTER